MEFRMEPRDSESPAENQLFLNISQLEELVPKLLNAELDGQSFLNNIQIILHETNIYLDTGLNIAFDEWEKMQSRGCLGYIDPKGNGEWKAVKDNSVRVFRVLQETKKILKTLQGITVLEEWNKTNNNLDILIGKLLQLSLRHDYDDDDDGRANIATFEPIICQDVKVSLIIS
jgi:hypothetical protein